MDITKAAINYSRVTVVVLACVLFGGLASFNTSPKAEDPGFAIRTALVRTMFPGASPDRVEQLVTDKLEKKIQEMPELKAVRSSTKNGVSTIFVDIRDEYRGPALRPIWDSLRRKVDSVRGDLPSGVIGPFVNDEFGDVFGTVLTLTGEGYDAAELKEIADEVRDDLLKIPDVAKVDIYGAQEERVFVEFRPSQLSELGLSPMQLQGLLQSQNIVAPGGSVQFRGQRISLEPSGNFQSVDDIRATLVRIPGSQTSVRLGDITRITRGYVDPPSSAFHATGEPGLALAISMRAGGNILTLGNDVRTLVDRLQSKYPWGVDLKLGLFQADDVDETISGFTDSLLQAIAVVLVCMLLFLGLRTGFVVASLIPSAMAATFVTMAALDMGLDKVSLAALIIALGLLVDNGVVMAEAALVNVQNGMTRVEASIAAAKELRGPLLISSLTTVAAFLPLALAENIMGEFLGPLAFVLATTLLASWLLAITVVPFLCSRFLKAPKKEAAQDGFGTPFYRGYRKLLTVLLKNRAVFLLGVLASFVGSVMLMGLLPQRFMSDSALATFTIELKGVPGTDFEYAEKTVAEVEEWMKSELLVNEERKEGVTHWVTYVGNGGPRFYLSHSPEQPTPEYGFIVANAQPASHAQTLVPKIRDYVTANYPDLQAVVMLRASGAGGTPVGYRLRGEDLPSLYAQAEALEAKLRSVPGVTNVRNDWGAQTPKVVVDVDDARLKRTGLTNQDVALSLTSAFDGYQVTEYREGEDVIPTILRSHTPFRGVERKVAALSVFSQGGSPSVPLAQVARPSMVWGPSVVKRYDRVPAITVSANLDEGMTAHAVNLQVEPWLIEQKKSWPESHSYKVVGEIETSNDANGAIGAKLHYALFGMLMLLVLQFNSIRRMTIVFMTIPLSLIGVVLGLLVTGSYFGFMALLGLLSLAGIVINNGIVLIDRIATEIDEGTPPDLALMESAQKRLRPILLTTATTIVGLFPLWFGNDPMWVPMAIGLIFGLLFATVLTLAFVPALYSVLYRISFKGFDYDEAKKAAAG